MLSMTGVSCNEYADEIGRNGSVPAVPCPAPGCQGRLQRGHGFYKRLLGGICGTQSRDCTPVITHSLSLET